MKKHKFAKRMTLGVFCVILLLLIGSGVYLSNYYHASDQAFDIIRSEHSTMTIMEKRKKQIIFQPQNVKAGLIFYPGGKVEYEAYAPLLELLAEKGVLCVLVHMPANLAVLDINAAEGIIEQYPQIKEWYIGGHSLGGAMAAKYVSKHTKEYNGLFLLGAYSTVDLSQSQLQVMSIYGSEDGVMNRTSYAKNKKNLPTDSKEIIMEGGCHSYFGSYGDQDGDGTPTISREEQLNQTVDAMSKIILNN